MCPVPRIGVRRKCSQNRPCTTVVLARSGRGLSAVCYDGVCSGYDVWIRTTVHMPVSYVPSRHIMPPALRPRFSPSMTIALTPPLACGTLRLRRGGRI